MTGAPNIEQLGPRVEQQDDVTISLRMSRANLTALEAGLRGSFTRLKLLKGPDGVYAMAVEGIGRDPAPNPVEGAS